MDIYVREISIGFGVKNAAALTVHVGGTAEIGLRYKTHDFAEDRRRNAVAEREAVEAGLVRRAQVGPPGGEDDVVVATDDLMRQLIALFGTKITASAED